MSQTAWSYPVCRCACVPCMGWWRCACVCACGDGGGTAGSPAAQTLPVSCCGDLDLCAVLRACLAGCVGAEWRFHFGFVIPGSTNSWQQVISAAKSGTLPASLLRCAGAAGWSAYPLHPPPTRQCHTVHTPAAASGSNRTVPPCLPPAPDAASMHPPFPTAGTSLSRLGSMTVKCWSAKAS